jgi:hypothetical protein
MKVLLSFTIVILMLFAIAAYQHETYAETGACPCETPEGLISLEGSALFLAIESLGAGESPQHLFLGFSNEELLALKDEIVRFRTADPAPLSLAEFMVLGFAGRVTLDVVSITPDGRLADMDDFQRLLDWTAELPFLKDSSVPAGYLTDFYVSYNFLQGQGTDGFKYIERHPKRASEIALSQSRMFAQNISPWFSLSESSTINSVQPNLDAVRWYFGAEGQGQDYRLTLKNGQTIPVEISYLPNEIGKHSERTNSFGPELTRVMAERIYAERKQSPAPLTLFEYLVLSKSENAEFETVFINSRGLFASPDETRDFAEYLSNASKSLKSSHAPNVMADPPTAYTFLTGQAANALQILEQNKERAANIRKSQEITLNRLSEKSGMVPVNPQLRQNPPRNPQANGSPFPSVE